MTFDQWFSTATKNIAESELPKIRNELEGHILDAIEAHQQTGLSRIGAETQAVLELGDPLEANSEMRKLYLTTDEAKRIDQVLKINFGWIAGFPIFLLAYAILRHDWTVLMLSFTLLFSTTEHIYKAFVAKKWDFKRQYRGLYYVQLCNMFVGTISMVGLSVFFPHQGYAAIFAAIAIFMAGITIWQIRESKLIRKLQTRA
jgi:hypothetical protein